jgi:tetratricopeptide (TPR) repeat protein
MPGTSLRPHLKFSSRMSTSSKELRSLHTRSISRSLRDHPDRADAWAGLVSALHATGHDQQAVDQIKTVPHPFARSSKPILPYLQTMASVYEALGRSREAAPFLNRVEQDYVAQRKSPPADVEIQNAWALYNGIQDADLYRQLMELGGRLDLSRAAPHRADHLDQLGGAPRQPGRAAGNSRRAVAILNAAAHAFPDNPATVKALAIGYAEAGEPHQAVIIYARRTCPPPAPPTTRPQSAPRSLQR